MRASRHKPEQIINILREAETSPLPLAELCRKHSISEETFYRWRRRFGGLDVSEARRVHDLTSENAPHPIDLANDGGGGIAHDRTIGATGAGKRGEGAKNDWSFLGPEPARKQRTRYDDAERTL